MVPSISVTTLGKNIASGLRHIVLVPQQKGKMLLPAQAEKFASMLKKEEFAGKSGETYIFNDGSQYLHFVGLGELKDLHATDIHKPLGNAVRMHLGKSKHLGIIPGHVMDPHRHAALLTEIVMTGMLASYSFDKYKTASKDKAVTKDIQVLLEKAGKEDKTTIERAVEIAEAVAWTRDIVNEPSNKTTPQYLAYLLKGKEKNTPFKVEVFDGKKIQSMGMNLVWAVGKGSSEEPHFAKVTYMGNPKNKKFVALVGKGVNFDTGGVQVKPDMYMNTMKGDMGGAALVMGTMQALARIKAKVNVIAYLPFVENSVDGSAYKPDDVYTAFNGKTVEIKHTDAEGRLILADALAYASQEHPTEILDFATLTGAALVALGNTYAAVMGTNQAGIDRLSSIGEEVNELVWQLPIHRDYRKLLDSNVADIANISEKRVAGTILGAMFLQEFVGEDIPWVHMDIAGVATDGKRDGIHSDFATGYGVRLMVEYLTRA